MAFENINANVKDIKETRQALQLVAKTWNGLNPTTGAMTAKSPETDAEAGFLTFTHTDGTEYEIPFYAKA